MPVVRTFLFARALPRISARRNFLKRPSTYPPTTPAPTRDAVDIQLLLATTSGDQVTHWPYPLLACVTMYLRFLSCWGVCRGGSPSLAPPRCGEWVIFPRRWSRRRAAVTDRSGSS